MQNPEPTADDAEGDSLGSLPPELVRHLARTITTAMKSDEDYRQLPIPIRALVAAALLIGTDQPVNQSTLATTGRYSRSTAHRRGGWNSEIGALITHGPTRFKNLLQESHQPPAVGIAELRRELDEAYDRLADERRRRKEAEQQLDPVVSYARDLSRELRRYREEELATLDRKLLLLPQPPPDENDDKAAT